MKKVFIMTPMKLTQKVNSEKINNYIRKAAEITKIIVEDEIEVETNFFLEPVGKDKDGEDIMQIVNANDEIAYMHDELGLMKDCDYIVMPECLGYGDLWSRTYIEFNHGTTWLNGRKILFVPIHVNDFPFVDIDEDEHEPAPRRRYR